MNSNIMEAKPRAKEKMKNFLNPRHKGKLKMTAAVPSLRKGKSKIMGVLQILIGLIITLFGALLFFKTNKIGLPKSSIPRFFITRYPFWTGACYTITGVFTILNGVKYESQDRMNLYMDVLSAMVSASGIGVLFYSLSVHQFLQCVHPSAGSICIMSEILLHGVLSILLILIILQFSIAAIILALKCRRTGESPVDEACSTSLREPRQFVTSWKNTYFQSSEVKEPKQTENVENQLQIQIEKNPSDKKEEKTSASLIRGYTFFKLRPLGSPITRPPPSSTPPPSSPPSSASPSSSPTFPQSTRRNDSIFSTKSTVQHYCFPK
ncbi:uncharacterized protein [Notamacropus eugenii]|uniref:uncharacterized protein n=1 Tax=Notamacropus eugenii TaxID=9315 RepID=UPI003B67BCFE